MNIKNLIIALVLTWMAASTAHAGSSISLDPWAGENLLAMQNADAGQPVDGDATEGSRQGKESEQAQSEAPTPDRDATDTNATDSDASGVDVSEKARADSSDGGLYGKKVEPAEDRQTVDIYAIKEPRKKPPYPFERQAGDHDVFVVPAARPLNEGDMYVSLDEFVLWRAGIGVTDHFSLEVNSAWGASAGLAGKYALLRENNTAVSLLMGMGALTFNKHTNWEYMSLLFSRDFHRGAVHLGGHAILYNEDKRKTSFVPQLTAGGEVRLVRRVTAIGEFGFGSDVLHGGGVGDNTGFINLGLRLHHRNLYATAGLAMPTSEKFLDSDVLGVPFVRIGGRF